MNFGQAIRRFIANAWLAAAPLVIVFLLIAIPLCLAIIGAIIEGIWGPDAAEDFSTSVFGGMMWGGELALGLAPIGLIAYGLYRLARWWLGQRKP